MQYRERTLPRQRLAAWRAVGVDGKLCQNLQELRDIGQEIVRAAYQALARLIKIPTSQQRSSLQDSRGRRGQARERVAKHLAGAAHVALTAMDREILKRCLHHELGAWNDFVDRFSGLIYHVIQHTAHLRSVPLRPEDTEDLAAEVLLQIVVNDYAVLRQFRGKCSLATYLTVIARRTCVQELARRAAAREVLPRADGKQEEPAEPPRAQAGLEKLEEVARLLKKLPGKERRVVRLFYLEGRSYEEISTTLNIPVNSIGPILSRARKKLLEDVKSPPREVKREEIPKPEGEQPKS